MKLNHINIRAPLALLELEKQFFCDVLGFTLGPRPAFSRPGFWLYSEGAPQIHLIEGNPDITDTTQGYFDHVAFESSGIADLLRALEYANVTFQVKYIQQTNVSQVFFFSPSGTGIEIQFPGEQVQTG